jgi:hypothetical protein
MFLWSGNDSFVCRMGRMSFVKKETIGEVERSTKVLCFCIYLRGRIIYLYEYYYFTSMFDLLGSLI